MNHDGQATSPNERRTIKVRNRLILVLHVELQTIYFMQLFEPPNKPYRCIKNMPKIYYIKTFLHVTRITQTILE